MRIAYLTQPHFAKNVKLREKERENEGENIDRKKFHKHEYHEF